jgi:hypothetical protein
MSSKPWRTPTCKTCGYKHMNWQRCDEPEVVRNRNPSVRVEAPRPDGLLPWRRDKLENVQRLSQNTFATRRVNPVNLGRLIFRDGPVRLPRMPEKRASLTYPPARQEEE